MSRVDAMRRTRLLSRIPVGVALAALALGASACGVSIDTSARVDDDANVPGGLLDPTTTPGTTEAPADGVEMRICLPDRSERFHETARVLAPEAGGRELLHTLDDALTDEERRAGFTASTFSADDVAAVGVEGGVATVQLTEEFATRPADDQLLVVAQVVCTLTAQPGIGQVHFELGSTSVEVPRGDGSTTSDPVSRLDYPGQIDPSTP